MFGHRKNQNHEATDNSCLSFSNTVHQIHYISELYAKIQYHSETQLLAVENIFTSKVHNFVSKQCVLILDDEKSEGKPQIIRGSPGRFT